MARDRVAHPIEVAETIERTSQRLPRPVLGVGQTFERVSTEPSIELLGAPLRPLAPFPTLCRMSELVAEVGDELLERGGRCRPAIVAGQRCQPPVPIVVTGHPGLSTDPLPFGGRQVHPIGVASGNVGEQIEHASAAQPASVDVEQVEDQPGRQPLGDGRSGSTVPRDLGDVEVVFDEPGVRPLSRPQDRDPLERCTSTRRGEDVAHREADLVVGVGGRDDPGRRSSTVSGLGRRARAGFGIRSDVESTPSSVRIATASRRPRRDPSPGRSRGPGAERPSVRTNARRQP